MQKKIKVVTILLIITCGCSYQSRSSENWVDYNRLSEISIGLSQNELEKTLGEPLLILGNNESDENIIYLFYNLLSHKKLLIYFQMSYPEFVLGLAKYFSYYTHKDISQISSLEDIS